MPPEASTEPAAKLYSYRARRQDGAEVFGRAAATDELHLDRVLQHDGLILVSTEAGSSHDPRLSLRMPRDELIGFTNQLATMIQAGIPILQALQHQERHANSKQTRVVINSMREMLEEGASLSEAFGAHPRVFPSTYVAMVRSGEVSTSLPGVLRRQGEYMDWLRDIKSVTRQAMIYPSALALAVLGLVFILITFLLPRLIGLFPGGYEDLPAQTRFVIQVSDLLRSNWIAFTALAIVSLGLLSFLVTIERTRILLAKWVLRVPRLGRVLDMLAVARFATTASTLQHSGCEIVSTLEIASDACGNSYLRERFREVVARVRAGEPISEAMDAAGGIDPYLVQLTAVGESSGRMAECLDFVAEAYNAEVPRVVKWALSLIEPCVLIFGGAIVAYLLVAAILPIFKVYETIG